MDDLSASSDNNASSSATVASSSTGSSPRSESKIRQQVARQHSYTHVFPATSELAGERIPQRHGATSRAAVRELLNPTSSMDPDDRSKMLFNGLQWLLESSTPSNDIDQRASGSHRVLSHDAVNEFNLDDKRRTAAQEEGSKASGSEAQCTRNWVDAQVRTKAAQPW